MSSVWGAQNVLAPVCELPPKELRAPPSFRGVVAPNPLAGEAHARGVAGEAWCRGPCRADAARGHALGQRRPRSRMSGRSPAGRSPPKRPRSRGPGCSPRRAVGARASNASSFGPRHVEPRAARSARQYALKGGTSLGQRTGAPSIAPARRLVIIDPVGHSASPQNLTGPAIGPPPADASRIADTDRPLPSSGTRSLIAAVARLQVRSPP